MTPQNFTIGVYEDRWAYVWLLAAAARDLVTDVPPDQLTVIWYQIHHPLAEWINLFQSPQKTLLPPFGERPFRIDGDSELLRSEYALKWTGQKDIRELCEQGTPPGGISIVEDMDECPLPNLIVVDHHLFDLRTAGLALEGGGHGQIIVQGLQEYFGGSSHTAPIFLTSQMSLAGNTGIDILGLGRGRGAHVSWFPRPEKESPTKLPKRFEQALGEEISFWRRNRDVLGTTYKHSDLRHYDPPFEHVVIHSRCAFHLDKSALEKETSAAILFRDRELTHDQIADALLARHCKAYLEIRENVTQEDVDRLRNLAERFPLPIVLIYWNAAENVGSLEDCGVLAHLVRGNKTDLRDLMQAAAVEWTQRLAAIDTVVGGQRLREIRDDLLRWRLATKSVGLSANTPKLGGHGMLVVGPTGAGKTAVSKWCHFYSNHITQDDQIIEGLLKDITVPDPDPKKEGHVMPLRLACHSSSPTDFLVTWAKTILDHCHSGMPENPNLLQVMAAAFKANGQRPWQVNLVGVTRHDEFVMQMAGAYPSWTGTKWPYGWRSGAILDATNNSLILNEIGELESDAQGLLLELIERGGPIRPMFAPIGAEVTARNVLFIMATDRVDRIREQLLYRCRMVRVPSLLEGQEDIPELARHRLMPRWCCLSERAEQLLKGWPYWPGNHRSLHGVLDFAAEQLPPDRRVIRVPDVIRALWKEDLIRIPTRLESLIKWILEWPELDRHGPGPSILQTVIDGLPQPVTEEWETLIEDLNKIAEQSLANPSAHFTDLLGTKNLQKAPNKELILSRAVRLFVHEIFWTLKDRNEGLESTIKAARLTREEKLVEVAGGDFEHRLVKELLGSALVTLSLATILWHVLQTKPADIIEANQLLNSRVPKATGRRSQDQDDAANGKARGLTTEDAKNKRMSGSSRTRDQVPRFDDASVSQTRSEAGQFSLAVVKANDSPLRRSLFDYAEDRRDRNYFSPRGHDKH